MDKKADSGVNFLFVRSGKMESKGGRNPNINYTSQQRA